MNSSTETANTPQTTLKDSSQLVKGDIVSEHGMRVRLDNLTTVERQGLTVYCWVGTVLNMDEVREAKHVPLSFLRTDKWEPGKGWVTDREDVWTVQGNKLATWAVEVSVPAELAELHGQFADGYTAEDINAVFGLIRDAGGPRLVCVWDYFDEYGYGGNSEFYAETKTGLHEVELTVHQWLSGEQDSPGPIGMWVCALATEPAEFAGGDDFHNYARRRD
ncbi:hypothetical protein ACFY1J_05540 [Streptomyces sp. NPDC001406]|uniref:hypothetical protein n=1 Tax=Streptomyces sp. NPDC001406 TaxID=3364572 RepID=UPI0036C8310B